ncbi:MULTISPECIES: gluconate 2-dehydrogenase subunit 3 family protein [unclassified Lysobacter]|uniref:gluconate 2-dehydrogenase subunit 3 family protein n=1 Tax=unclassified Lysobacter TaxID=2635362 RepID=UPI001BE63372|nr:MULTISPECIES: gluconate 2-dehydrogenase subunit 3 family protein [unclassified Lysobacter]MBT2744915.1 gluconate 2-dehydrogenase subunit 3 family protein [Lysobacter sp. ISL-42]MBT2752092.1 gluconate 2-dehydrogenase subunit 3 family protein [Lysobacter sp. ISL-50]MBT2778589.1 gluconate 2-dehydrogenase subunit 3 family protein [Lysobacter sp. ISL-54]MBT2780480.1 gluconate 2-dehydrogenase subunit 3 family protein [Lysobacter sp. ISL-52]
MGGAVSAPAILGVLAGCSAEPGTSAEPGKNAEWKPIFLTQAQAALVAEVAEIMIPRTDTPGAKDVGIAAFIDKMLKDVYPKEDQARFVAGLADFETQAKREHGRGFLELEPALRAAAVKQVHDPAVKAEDESTLPRAQRHRPFILIMKELTLLGYFTSEPGATQVLQYRPIPGAYHACVPLAQAGNGKTWATETSRAF